MNIDKSWLKQPGECHDSKGVPIYPGDLLKSLHFVGPRRKKYYLYHVAVLRDGAMWLVPPCHLQPEKIKLGGSCLLSDNLAGIAEVIDGYGPGDLAYEDRPKAKGAK